MLERIVVSGIERIYSNIFNKRKARCSCGFISNSNPELPFFKEKLNKEFDEYYCGCEGWN